MSVSLFFTSLLDLIDLMMFLHCEKQEFFFLYIYINRIKKTDIKNVAICSLQLKHNIEIYKFNIYITTTTQPHPLKKTNTDSLGL